jgi:hypothetical protein
MRASSAYVGHAEGWDELTIDGSIEARDCGLRYERSGRLLAVASIYRDLANLEADGAASGIGPELIHHCARQEGFAPAGALETMALLDTVLMPGPFNRPMSSLLRGIRGWRPRSSI